MSLVGCKKDGFLPFSDNRPTIPVNVDNQYDLFLAPTVSSSYATGTITIKLSIPANSGRTIKEITRVGTSTSSAAPSVVQKSTATGVFSNTPIPGSGNSVVFTTTYANYTTVTGAAVPLPTASSALLSRFFYFLVTLDDGSTIIPQCVKVYVLP
ncbi:MAG: hypothetical protein J0I09_09395 [Sphingobacteriia bacterium]|nr:hypothetical protein [Sphingobacteriia bacterium]